MLLVSLHITNGCDLSFIVTYLNWYMRKWKLAHLRHISHIYTVYMYIFKCGPKNICEKLTFVGLRKITLVV